MTLEKRLDDLERSNRRIRGGLIACLLFIIATTTMGAIPNAPKTIDAEKIVLRDSEGHERGQLFATEKAWGLVLFSKNGEKAASFFASPEVAGIFVADQNGNPRQSLLVDVNKTEWNIFHPGSNSAQFTVTDNPEGTGMIFRDRTNMQRIEVGVSSKGPAVAVSDSNGTMRTVLSDEQIASFSKDGQIEWSPAWDKLSPAEKEHLKGLLPKMPTAKQ